MSDSNHPPSTGSGESAFPQQPPKIRFGNPPIAGSAHPAPPAPASAVSAGNGDGPAASGEASTTIIGSKKIRAFGKDVHHGEKWQRTPNATGQGATHVRTFHSKLTDDSLAFMDQVINEWLDQHPEYEVKFVSCAIGEFTGKIREPALICQVWV